MYFYSKQSKQNSDNPNTSWIMTVAEIWTYLEKIKVFKSKCKRIIFTNMHFNQRHLHQGSDTIEQLDFAEKVLLFEGDNPPYMNMYLRYINNT